MLLREIGEKAGETTVDAAAQAIAIIPRKAASSVAEAAGVAMIAAPEEDLGWTDDG